MSSREETRDSIVGLGPGSARKSYYPQLVKTIKDLEQEVEEHKRLLSEKNLLLHEMHHRVRNNFQIMLSLLDLGAQGQDSEERRFADTARRFRAMAAVYDHFAQDGEYSRVEVAALIRTLAAPTPVDLRGDDCPDIGVDSATALAIATSEAISAWESCGCLRAHDGLCLTLDYDESATDPHLDIIIEPAGTSMSGSKAETCVPSLALGAILARQAGGEIEMELPPEGGSGRVRVSMPAIPT